MEKIPAAELLMQLRAPDARRPVTFPPKLAPATEAEAYGIQMQVFALLGAGVAGWKASMPDASRGMSAPIASGNLLQGQAQITDLAHRTHHAQQLGIEPEVAFRMARALPPRADGCDYTRAEVLAAVGSAHPALEICACRFGELQGAMSLERLADGIVNEGLVIGAPTTAWRELNLAQLPLSLRIDGSVIHRGVGGHPLGDPLIPMVWMANHLAARGIGLKPGDVITTGSCAGIHLLAPGQSAGAKFSGLGTVTLQA